MKNKADETLTQDLPALPEGTELLPAPEWAIEPTGAPEEFGLTRDSRPSKKRVWDRQEVFLAAFAECGKPVVAARNSGISYWTYIHWERHDVFGFRDRLKVAHDIYCQDKIETMIDDRLEDPQGNRGSDVLLMFKGKAEMPEKYRETVTVVDHSATKEMLDRLRAMGTPRVVEGSLVPQEPAQEPE